MVPVGLRREANIPYFAMPVEKKENRASAVNDERQIRKFISGNVYQWLRDTSEYRSAWRLIMTREFVPPKTAVYCTWLLFARPELEQQFLTRFPNISSDVRMQTASKKIDDLRAALETGVIAGGYDLSKIAFKTRRDVAAAYIKKHDQVQALMMELNALTKQAEDIEKWRHLSLQDFP